MIVESLGTCDDHDFFSINRIRDAFDFLVFKFFCNSFDIDASFGLYRCRLGSGLLFNQEALFLVKKEGYLGSMAPLLCM